jgi:hypothetical protein
MTWVDASSIIAVRRSGDARGQVEPSLIVVQLATNHFHPAACKAYSSRKMIALAERNLYHGWTSASVWIR